MGARHLLGGASRQSLRYDWPTKITEESTIRTGKWLTPEKIARRVEWVEDNLDQLPADASHCAQMQCPPGEIVELENGDQEPRPRILISIFVKRCY